MKKAFILFFSFYFLFVISPKAFASQNFSVSSDVTYTITDTKKAHAQFLIKLVNKSTKYYASSYKINVGFAHLENVAAKMGNDAIPTKIHETPEGDTIELVLGTKVIGKDKVADIILTFDTPDIVQALGNSWELNIPGISEDNEFDDFNVTIKVPDRFGEPTYIKPAFTLKQNGNTLIFHKTDLQKSGISIAYGNQQIYNFTLEYNLKNSNLFPLTQEIALPPTTNYQTIAYDDISPKPQQVIIDPDGNWIASYKVSAGETKTIIAKGQAKVSLFPQKVSISKEEKELYTKPQKYWETNSTEIKKLAKQLGTPAAIYKFVIGHLSYDFSRVSNNQPRRGALQVLKDPSSAVCLEFTDLFIALARSAGIPAREINGFAYTQNSKQQPLSEKNDVLHSWPEYYDFDVGTLIMVDPTWGGTTGGVDYFNLLDFDHIAFVIKGTDSQYPVPAGGYKINGKEQKKDIKIDFAKSAIAPLLPFSFITQTKNSYMAGFPISGDITIYNSGNSMLSGQTVLLQVSNLKPTQQTIIFPDIPPYGHKTIPFSYKSPVFLTKLTDILTISVGNKKATYQMHIQPFDISSVPIYITGGIISVISLIIIFTITRRTGRI
ncbi:MAG: transglutaminase domain-containing protein [Patescibacteria group bacterium]